MARYSMAAGSVCGLARLGSYSRTSLLLFWVVSGAPVASNGVSSEMLKYLRFESSAALNVVPRGCH